VTKVRLRQSQTYPLLPVRILRFEFELVDGTIDIIAREEINSSPWSELQGYTGSFDPMKAGK
jgi:hypothetical protein